MNTKLLPRHHLVCLSLKEATQARLSLHLSNATMLGIWCGGSNIIFCILKGISPFKIHIHWNAFRTRSYKTRCSIEHWYNVVPVFYPLELTFFPEMAGETECQTSERKRKIAWPDLYCSNDLMY